MRSAVSSANSLIEKQVANLRLFRRHAHRLAYRCDQVLAITELPERRIRLEPLRLVVERAVLVRGKQVTDDRRIVFARPSSISLERMCSGSLDCVLMVTNSGSSRAPNEVSSTS